MMSENKNFINDTVDRTSEFDQQDIEQNKVISGFAYLGILFFLPLVACPNSKFGRFHANQGLLIFICQLIVGAIGRGFWFLLFIGGMIHTVLYICVFLLLVFGMVNTFNGKAKELPIIGTIKLIH
jgi:uncharacterized membrane protein